MLAVVQSNAFALSKYLRFQRAHLGIVRTDGLTLDRIFDAPIDHVARQCYALKLDLKLGIGLRVSVRGVGMAHIATHAARAAEQFCRVKDLVAVLDESVGLRFPYLVIVFVKTSVGIALLAFQLPAGAASGYALRAAA
jgi:hypothetical protein